MCVIVLLMFGDLFILIIYILSKSVSAIGVIVTPLNPKTISGTVLVCPAMSTFLPLILFNLLIRLCVWSGVGSNCIIVMLCAVASGCAVCCVLRQVETNIESTCLESSESFKAPARLNPCGCARGALQLLLVFSACLTT